MTLTARMKDALRLLASAREVRVVTSPNPWLANEIATRTAWALERRGWGERYYTGDASGCLVITDKGRAVADELGADDVSNA